MKGQNQHVVPQNGGWVVHTPGSDRDTIRAETQGEAIKRAREIAQQDQSEVIVYGRDGKIQERISHHNNQTTEEFYLTERIVVTPDIVHGKPRIAGTRILVQTILDLVAAGKTEEEIISEDYYPDLSIDDVRACVAFASRVIENSEFLASNDDTARPLYPAQIFKATPGLGI